MKTSLSSGLISQVITIIHAYNGIDWISFVFDDVFIRYLQLYSFINSLQNTIGLFSNIPQDLWKSPFVLQHYSYFLNKNMFLKLFDSKTKYHSLNQEFSTYYISNHFATLQDSAISIGCFDDNWVLDQYPSDIIQAKSKYSSYHSTGVYYCSSSSSSSSSSLLHHNSTIYIQPYSPNMNHTTLFTNKSYISLLLIWSVLLLSICCTLSRQCHCHRHRKWISSNTFRRTRTPLRTVGLPQKNADGLAPVFTPINSHRYY
ncbi:hypothetical protein WA158_000423 [Blastocystis sp. Blastoise]